MTQGNGDNGDDVLDAGELGPAAKPANPPSDEQPVVVFGVDDSDDEAKALSPTNDDELLPEPDLPSRQQDEGALHDAYANLEIRTPPEELDAFARGRVEAFARLGQGERASRAQDALKMAQGALRRVMGALPREAP